MDTILESRPNDFIIKQWELWGGGCSSPGLGWCYPWDQDTEEGLSVTTTLFALYLRILLYNKFDVAKPSDHITTIKLIPLS